MVPLLVKWCCRDSVEYRERCQATGSMRLVPGRNGRGKVDGEPSDSTGEGVRNFDHGGCGALLGPGRDTERLLSITTD